MVPLTADQWPRIEALFSALVDATPAERARALAETAATDPELAATVEGMLAHASGGAHLQQVVDAVAGTLTDGAVTATLPARFGIYRTVREVGRGGMGVVYEGVSDDEYARRVAIKVAPLARIGAGAEARFRLERQILSSLEHPHIARFLDGGAEGDLPYFVMEFVQGEPITTYVARRALPLDDRLRLVQKLCGALQYAHQRLVVHRDLKPSNILVTDDGTPKLLDFGVAKLLDGGDVATPTIGITAWTPDYASPEQVSGVLVGTPSDIYSLGLVLYEVLTGARAQTGDTTSPLALSRSVCDTDPPKPSDRVATAGDRVLARRLRGDLDTIVMTAIHKDASRRYASAGALSDDIDRYLSGLPVEARAGTLWYRLRKAVARHRGAAAAAVLLTLAIAGGFISTAYQARRADRRFQQVRALANEFVFGVHDRIQTLPGSTEARRALVQTALTYLENLREDAADDAGLAKELAAAYEKVGLVQGHPLTANLGEPEAAIVSFTRAIDLLAPFDATGDLDARVKRASVVMRLAAVHGAQGDLAAMLSGYERARAMGEQVLQAQPANEAALDLLGEVNATMARTANDRRDVPTAVAAAERALQAAETLRALKPDDAKRLNNLGTAYHAVATARLAQGQLQQSAEAFRKSVEIREALVAAAPTDTDVRRALVVALGNMGDILGGRSGENIGDQAGAGAAFERAVSISREIAAADPKDRRAAFDLVNGLLRLGAVWGDVPERQAASLAYLEEADRVNATLLAGEPGSARYAYLQIVLDRRLGRLLRQMGRHDEAMRRLTRARHDAQAQFTGPNGVNARQQYALAAVDLATLWAETHDRRALETALAVPAEIAGAKMAPLLEAQTRASLGHALALLAPQAPTAATAAREQLTASADVWRKATLPASLNPQRDKALELIAADLAVAEAAARR